MLYPLSYWSIQKLGGKGMARPSQPLCAPGINHTQAARARNSLAFYPVSCPCSLFLPGSNRLAVRQFKGIPAVILVKTIGHTAIPPDVGMGRHPRLLADQRDPRIQVFGKELVGHVLFELA